MTRNERKLLRRLASVAYERELGHELDRVLTVFEAWKAAHASPHDVSEAIHEFHNGVARELYVLYNRIDPSHSVPRALADGWLNETELPSTLLAKLESALAFYRSERADQAPEARSADDDTPELSV